MIGRLPYPQESEPLLVPSDFRKCVAYLSVDVLDEERGIAVRQPAGTAFFVSFPVEDIGFVLYIVTARHVIDSARPYVPLFVRVNLPGGGFYDASGPDYDSWEMHPTTDVAVSRVKIDPTKVEAKAIPVSMFLADERIAVAKENPLGEGDEVVFVGLFTSHPGRSRSEPVVRFGHIARMPYDPIPIRMDPAENSAFVPVRAYLAEATAWGGQSGSPAFVYFAPDRVPGSIQIGGPTGGGFALLGLVHGHYFYEQKINVTSGDISGQGKIDFNLGISVVIPAQDILTVLNSEVLMEQRSEAAAAYRKAEAERGESVPNPDAPLPDSTPTEYERFEDLTRKLVNTPKAAIDEKRSEGRSES
jgi:Trypsin-like peptidase domain